MTLVDEGSPLIYSGRFVLSCDCLDYLVAVPSRGEQAGGQFESLVAPAGANVGADRLRLSLSVVTVHNVTIPSRSSQEKAPPASILGRFSASECPMAFHLCRDNLGNRGVKRRLITAAAGPDSLERGLGQLLLRRLPR